MCIRDSDMFAFFGVGGFEQKALVAIHDDRLAVALYLSDDAQDFVDLGGQLGFGAEEDVAVGMCRLVPVLSAML